MPSKIQLDENLWFLYVCLQNSDYKSIDFNGVGDVTNLKAPAARMRYTRLRRAIESGTLIGTHGTPFQGGADKIAEGRKKRKKISDESDEEGAPVVRTPTSGRLALESRPSKAVRDRNDNTQESDTEDTPGAKKKRRRAIKSEDVLPDACFSDMNLENPSTDMHATSSSQSAHNPTDPATSE